MPRYQANTTYKGKKSCIQELTNGTCTWTVPSGITEVTFELWAAGASGAGHCCCDCYHAGPGGAGGGYTTATITTIPGCQYSIVVGAGGSQDSPYYACCGVPGGVTCITGYNIPSTLYATSGRGGVNDCYYACGCTFTAATAGGGGIVARGVNSAMGGGSSVTCIFAVSGGPPFMNSWYPWGSDHCCGEMYGDYGRFPGGSGLTGIPFQCCACTNGGGGASGLVRIHY